jgi:hypothetical protein
MSHDQLPIRSKDDTSIPKVLQISQIPDDSMQKGFFDTLTRYQLKAILVIDTYGPERSSFQLTLRRHADTPLVFHEAEHVFDDHIALRGVYVNALRWLADLFQDDEGLELFRGIRI